MGMQYPKTACLKDDVVDEEVRGCGKGRADAGSDACRVFDQHPQLGEDGPSQHGTQKDVEHIPHKEDEADTPVQTAQGG